MANAPLNFKASAGRSRLHASAPVPAEIRAAVFGLRSHGGGCWVNGWVGWGGVRGRDGTLVLCPEAEATLVRRPAAAQLQVFWPLVPTAIGAPGAREAGHRAGITPPQL